MRNKKREREKERIRDTNYFGYKIRDCSVRVDLVQKSVDRLVCADESQRLRVVYQVRSSQLACRKRDSMNSTSVTDLEFN